MAASGLPPLQLGQRPRRFLKQDVQCSPSLGARHVGRRGVAGTGRLAEAARRRQAGKAPAPLPPGVTHHAALLLQPGGPGQLSRRGPGCHLEGQWGQGKGEL